MKFKKIALFAAALAVCAAAFTACGDNSSNEEETTTAATTTTSQSQSEAATDAQTSEEADGGEETEISGEISGGEQDSPAAGGILSEAADAALAGASWPVMEKLEEPEFVSDFFLLDMANANYKDILILKCPMSANLSELIIIEAEDVSAAQADLEARQKKAREQDAWYPDDVEKAGASIVGTEGSYVYFIMGSDPESVESALVDYLKSAG